MRENCKFINLILFSSRKLIDRVCGNKQNSFWGNWFYLFVNGTDKYKLYFKHQTTVRWTCFARIHYVECRYFASFHWYDIANNRIDKKIYAITFLEIGYTIVWCKAERVTANVLNVFVKNGYAMNFAATAFTSYLPQIILYVTLVYRQSI